MSYRTVQCREKPKCGSCLFYRSSSKIYYWHLSRFDKVKFFWSGNVSIKNQGIHCKFNWGYMSAFCFLKWECNSPEVLWVQHFVILTKQNSYLKFFLTFYVVGRSFVSVQRYLRAIVVFFPLNSLREIVLFNISYSFF